MIDDKDYFDEYSRKINNNPEAIRCIYEYLKNYDIERVVPKKLFQKHRPSSDMYKELVDSNREKEWYLIRDIVVENINKTTVKMEIKDLWNEYRMYCLKNNQKLNITDRRFYMLISQIIIADVNKKVETADGFVKFNCNSKDYYVIDIEKMKIYFELNEEKVSFIPED